MHSFANFRKYKSPVTLTLTWIGSRSYQHAQLSDWHSVKHYRNMVIWISWNIDIRVRDIFPRQKFKNWAPTSYRPCPILWLPTISFELHAKVAEEIDLEMCSWQLLQVQMLCDLDLDLGSGQGHINIHSTCRTTSMPNHVTVASRTTEI